MFKSSMGGGVAARSPVYRHALARVIMKVLGPLPVGGGWSMAALALAAVLMSLDAGPTLAQRFESALMVLDRALPRRRRTGRTFQGFVKALMQRSGTLMGVMAARMRRPAAPSSPPATPASSTSTSWCPPAASRCT